MGKDIVQVTQDGLERLDEFSIKLQKLYDHVGKARAQATPREHVKSRLDGFEYASMEYMIDQMDKFHPIRSEEFACDPIVDTSAGAIFCAVVVTDLMTGERRIGGDAHRITFKKGEVKGRESLIDLGNDFKSAISEAIRNAYSRFGIAADIYKKQLAKEVTVEQQERYKLLSEEMEQNYNDAPEDIKPSYRIWIDGIKKSWPKCTSLTATKFLDNLTNQVRKSKVKESPNE